MHTANVVVAWLNAMQDRLRAEMRDLGVEARDLAALTLVAAYDGCSQDWLRPRVELTQSGTVRLVDRLTARGLLTRGASTGRGVPLHLAPGGQELLASWGARRDAAITAMLDALAPDVRTGLVDGMAQALLTQPRERRHADTACRVCTWPACGADCPVDRSVTP
ncbi:MarR family winged helix-turn-helix transcriptional regulator [Actinoplanes sp. CA-142083]|uniref:MarR family winged helix-turn-helix transcriptional regulator n=1 Tax=Actinoplanes sp. CA-142083 TaxID=3239903 RepID=UPI003D8FE5E3